MMATRFSPWGGVRSTGVILLCTTLIALLVGFVFDTSWRVGWCILFLALSFELLQGALDLRARFYIFDAPLFCLGMLIFTTVDPLFAVIAGTDFPGVDDSFYRGNIVGNMTGLVVASFCLSFFVGRRLIGRPCVCRNRFVYRTEVLKVTSLHVLMVATTLSLLAFLLNGGGFSMDNLVHTIAARSRGYVAFSSSGLGTEDPLVALLGQAIPTTVVIWLISLNHRRMLWSVFAALMAFFLFLLYVLLGGRSGVIFILVTLAIFQLVRGGSRPKLSSLAVLAISSLAVLGFQANYRDRGDIGEGFFELSPFRGFALNREIAFIVDNYGQKTDFVRGVDLAPRMALPLIDTIAVFAVNPIPRIFWPNKPVDPSFGPYNELRTGNTGFESTSNITPTIPGRYYISYGFFGVIQMGLLFGILWRLFDRMLTDRIYISENRVLVAAMLDAIMFISLRDFTFGKFYPLLFLLLFIMIGQRSLGKNRVPRLEASQAK